MATDIGRLSSALGYESAAPLRPEIERTDEGLDISTSWIRYDGIRRRRVPAILVEPSGEGPFAGLVFLHPFSGDKMFFLGEAKRLAAEGVVSLLIDAPHNRPRPDRLVPDLKDLKRLRQFYLQTIGDVRRGYDLLAQLDSTDSGRFGYVGRGEGADLAPGISALEPRVVTAISIAGIPRRSSYWGESNSAEALQRRRQLGNMELKRYTRAVAEFDAAPLLAHAQARNWLFQIASDGNPVPEGEIELLRRHLTVTADVRSYETRALNSAAAMDRRRWLLDKLRIC